jgi:putative membrane protein
MRFITKFILIALAVMGIAWLLPEVEVYSLTSALWVTLVLSILNLIVKPVLILFTIPLTIFTFGLFLLVINGLMVWITSRWIEGFYIATFGKAVFFGILLSVSTYLIERLLGPRRYYRGPF